MVTATRTITIGHSQSNTFRYVLGIRLMSDQLMMFVNNQTTRSTSTGVSSIKFPFIYVWIGSFAYTSMNLSENLLSRWSLSQREKMSSKPCQRLDLPKNLIFYTGVRKSISTYVCAVCTHMCIVVSTKILLAHRNFRAYLCVKLPLRWHFPDDIFHSRTSKGLLGCVCFGPHISKNAVYVQ